MRGAEQCSALIPPISYTTSFTVGDPVKLSLSLKLLMLPTFSWIGGLTEMKISRMHLHFFVFLFWSARRPLWSYLERIITTCLSLTLPWILSLSKISFWIKFLLIVIIPNPAQSLVIVIIACWKIGQAFCRRIECQTRRRSRVPPWNVTSLLQKTHCIAMQCLQFSGYSA